MGDDSVSLKCEKTDNGKYIIVRSWYEENKKSKGQMICCGKYHEDKIALDKLPPVLEKLFNKKKTLTEKELDDQFGFEKATNSAIKLMNKKQATKKTK